MNARHRLWRLTVCLLLLALLGGAASCGGKAAAGPPQAWIDSPADGASMPSGAPVPLVCRAAAPKGLSEVLLSVNGTPYRSMPVAEAATSSAVTIDWLPAGPGSYTLQVTAYDSTGTGSTPATVIVKVEDATSALPAETPALTATATATEEVEPTPTPTMATATPKPTTEPSATPSLTPFPPPQVSFTVDQDAINEGQCTTLHWSVEYVTAVYLDGAGVVGNDSREVCPPDTTTYTLHVEAPGGNVDRSVTVTVRRDETAPAVPKPKLPEDGQAVTPATCPAKVALDWSPVDDPTGVAYYVRVQWKDGATWRNVDEWGPVGDSAVKVVLQCSKIYRWSVRARDGAGNASAWSLWFEFKLGGG